MTHFYVLAHKWQSLASKAPKFSMNNNHLSLYPHTKISRVEFQEVAENLI